VDETVSTKEFWSILVNSVTMGAGAMGQPTVTVTAQLVYITHVIQGRTEEYVPWYLTDALTPITFTIPPWFFRKPVDKISARDVVNQFVQIFRKPIDIIPQKPIDVPMHKIPPVKRKAFVKAYKKAMESRFLVPPPGGKRSK
jgi:hypothetical protein